MLNHFVDLFDFSLEDVMKLLAFTEDIKLNMAKFSNCCNGKILGTMFYEPSTRTQFSFHSAMYRLGGKVIGFGDYRNSSISKGEDFKDTVKIMSSYVDLLVVRHLFEGAARAASLFSNCPIVNAGDGSHLHPTQTLTDLFTIYQQKKRLSGLTIGFCGDLKYGRTVHSLVSILTKFENNKFVFISGDELKIPAYIKKLIDLSKNEYIEISSIEGLINEFDVLYMTRIQKERFKDGFGFASNSTRFKLNLKLLEKSKDELMVLHPLPRLDEIDYEVDRSPKAFYFNQATNGLFVRMALIVTIFNNSSLFSVDYGFSNCTGNFCKNESCITNHEKYLVRYVKKFGDGLVCGYCDGEVV